MTLDELNLHFDAVEQLNSARDRLQSMSSFLKAQRLDGMPQGAGEHRKVEQLSILIEQQEEEVRRMERIVKTSEIIGGKNTENSVKSQCYRYLQSTNDI